MLDGCTTPGWTVVRFLIGLTNEIASWIVFKQIIRPNYRFLYQNVARCSRPIHFFFHRIQFHMINIVNQCSISEVQIYVSYDLYHESLILDNFLLKNRLVLALICEITGYQLLFSPTSIYMRTILNQ